MHACMCFGVGVRVEGERLLLKERTHSQIFLLRVAPSLAKDSNTRTLNSCLLKSSAKVVSLQNMAARVDGSMIRIS